MPDYNRLIPKNDILFIDWNLATICNYKCSYCSPSLHDGKNKFVEIEKILNVLTKIKNTHPNKHVNVIFTGGEPTIWSGLPDLLFELDKYKFEVQLITNGSQKLEWWDKYAHLVDLFIMSYHWEFANRDHFKEVCKIIRNKNHPNIKVNILVLKDKVEESIILGKEIVSEVPGIAIALRPIRVNHGIDFIDYTPEQLELINSNSRFGGMFRTADTRKIYNENIEVIDPDRIILEKDNNFYGWKCYAGIDCIKIREDGYIYRANCNMGGPIGHIQDDFELPVNPIICNKNGCKCSADIRARKEKI